MLYEWHVLRDSNASACYTKVNFLFNSINVQYETSIMFTMIADSKCDTQWIRLIN